MNCTGTLFASITPVCGAHIGVKVFAIPMVFLGRSFYQLVFRAEQLRSVINGHLTVDYRLTRGGHGVIGR